MMDPTLHIGVGAILGGLLTRIITHRQKKEIMKAEEAAAIRAELRIDLSKLQAKMEQINQDLDRWKEKYYKLADENMLIRERCRILEAEIGELKDKLNEYSSEASGLLDPRSTPQTQ